MCNLVVIIQNYSSSSEVQMTMNGTKSGEQLLIYQRKMVLSANKDTIFISVQK